MDRGKDAMVAGTGGEGTAWRRFRHRLAAVYVALLMASWTWVGRHEHPIAPDAAAEWSSRIPDGAEAGSVELDASAGIHPMRLSYLHWGPEPGSAGVPPVVLLHGGPGRAADFGTLAPMLVGAGGVLRPVYAIDLAGFGRSTRNLPNYSILTDAKAVAAWMRALGIAHAHIVGWSQGGGVAIHLSDLARDRVASVTLMGAIGAQRTEGSRSYAFEHFRYGAGDALRRLVPLLTPNFGFIPTAPPAFIRYFADSDQRPLEAIMRRISAPMLVLHGRRDYLVHPWAALEHARIIPGAQVIMTPWSHFVPFWAPAKRAQVAEWLGEFWRRSDVPAADGGRSTRPALLDLAPTPRLFGTPGLAVANGVIRLSWVVIALGLGLLSLRRGPGARWSVALGAALVVGALVDYGVVWVGLTAGALGWLALSVARGLRGRAHERVAFVGEWRDRAARGPAWAGALAVLRPDLRAEVGRAAAVLPLGARCAFLLAAAVTLAVHRLGLLIAAMYTASLIYRDPFHPWGEAGLVLGLVAARMAVGLVDHLLTIPGRRLLRADAARAARFEFWPTWLVYLLIAPTFVRGALRAGHPLAFTACNPGIENGGGVVGESKYRIMEGLRDGLVEAGHHNGVVSAICRTHLIEEDASAAARASRVRALVSEGGEGDGVAFPAILKPDSGYRGFSVRRVESEGEAEAYFRMMPRPALLQTLHEGPGEVGVLWARRPGPALGGGGRGRGRIFSVTLKQFSSLEGDGRRTLEDLVLTHPRYRLQARTFLARLAGRRLEVPARAQRVALAASGNHCQGTVFKDGAHLITPELEAAIDTIASSFRGRGAGLDMGRFDVRYRSEEDLRAGRLDPHAIIELNGTFGETTNIYDPDKPLSWSLDYLRRQWAMLYDLGAERMREGVRPMSVPAFALMIARNYLTRRGSALAD